MIRLRKISVAFLVVALLTILLPLQVLAADVQLDSGAFFPTSGWNDKGIAVDDDSAGYVYTADFAGVVRKFKKDGTDEGVVIFDLNDKRVQNEVSFWAEHPTREITDVTYYDGALYVVAYDMYNMSDGFAVFKIDLEGELLFAFSTTSIEGQSFEDSFAIAVGSSGIYVSNYDWEVHRFDLEDGTYLSSSSQNFYYPVNLTIDESGQVWVVDIDGPDSKLVILNPELDEVVETIELDSEPAGVALDSDNARIYLTDDVAENFYALDAITREVLAVYDVQGTVSFFRDLVIDAAGNVFVSSAIEPEHEFYVESFFATILESDDVPQKIPAKIPAKRDPLTLASPAGNVQTDDLAYLVAIPEQWRTDVTQVEFWLDAAEVMPEALDYPYLAAARTNLETAGATLLQTHDIRLMQRVTYRDGSSIVTEVDPAAIRGNITIRLQVPAALSARQDLRIAWVEETGSVAFLEARRVTSDGIDYLEWANNNFTSAYAIIA